MGQIQYGQFSERMTFFGGGGLGALVNSRWQLEADYLAIINRYVKRVIFPENYRLKYWNIGLTFRYHVVGRNKVYAFLSARTAAGRIQWISTEDSENKFSDNFLLLTPDVGVGFRLFPFISIEYAIGYNKAFEIELIGLEHDAIDGFEMNLKLKIMKNRSR